MTVEARIDIKIDACEICFMTVLYSEIFRVGSF